MAEKIIVGRTASDKKKLGDRGAVFLGKHYVKMGETVSLSSEIYMDMARSHVVLVCGKRGSGKSYTLGVIAEAMSKLPKDVSDNLSILIFDTMGVFWTMKNPNWKEEDLLRGWNSAPGEFDNLDIYTPAGYVKQQKESGIPVDYSFMINTSELNAGDWCNAFGIDLMDSVGILIERVIAELQDLKKEDYDIDDILKFITSQKNAEQKTKNAAENRFIAAKGWGLFGKSGTKIKDIVKPGRVSILDISCYNQSAGSWGIKTLVTGLLSKKLLSERMISRKLEELKSLEAGKSYFGFEKTIEGEKMPLVWLMIDEAHEFLPREGKTAASDALVQLLREGRQPGISMVLATQQPGEIHKDVITQSDIVLSHRITAKKDIDALNNMMQTYLLSDIQKYISNLPRMKGSAIILDDNSERIYPMQMRPRITWHGGEAPTAVPVKRKGLLDLGL
ncbi:ATP-binding protein [archaeon]|jgi:uncharacterized protein|nr:ATP-binding protein [archaeon]